MNREIAEDYFHLASPEQAYSDVSHFYLGFPQPSYVALYTNLFEEEDPPFCEINTDYYTRTHGQVSKTRSEYYEIINTLGIPSPAAKYEEHVVFIPSQETLLIAEKAVTPAGDTAQGDWRIRTASSSERNTKKLISATTISDAFEQLGAPRPPFHMNRDKVYRINRVPAAR